MARKKTREEQDTRTVNEIIAEMRNSAVNSLMVIVEGKDDLRIYRDIALRFLSASQVVFLFVGTKDDDGKRDGGGRNSLLELFKQVKTDLPNLKREILFFADRDLKVFEAIPMEWEGIHFTNGYSIENDLFADGQPHRSLYADEREYWEILMTNLCNWFSGQVRLWLDGRAAEMKIDLNMKNPSQRDVILEASSPNDPDLANKIREDFVRLTRGKHLFELLLHIHEGRIEKGQMAKTRAEHFWQDCINLGLENHHSQTNRIAHLLRTRVGGGRP
jgi:Protein of unknown function (DUF4435)